VCSAIDLTCFSWCLKCCIMAYFADKSFYCIKSISQTLQYSHLYLRAIFFNINNYLFSCNCKVYNWHGCVCFWFLFHCLIFVLTTWYISGTQDVIKQLSEKGLRVSSPPLNINMTVITSSTNPGPTGAVLDTSCTSAVNFLIWVNWGCHSL